MESSTPITIAPTGSLIDGSSGRLLTAFLPIEYHIEWDVVDAVTAPSAAAPLAVAGRVTIQGVLNGEWNADGVGLKPLALHAKRDLIDITAVKVTLGGVDGTTITVAWDWSPVLGEDAGTVRVPPTMLAAPGTQVIVSIQFLARLPPAGAMHGLYVARWDTSSAVPVPALLATQFQPVSARKAFPCVDEPAAKAVFAVSVTLPPSWHVLGNTAQVAAVHNASGSMTVSFAVTPRMAPYLLAIVAAAPGHIVLGASRTLPSAGAPAGFAVTVRGPVEVRAWCRREDDAYKTQLAVDTAASAVVFMEALTGLRFPLGKLDLVVVDAFDSGAMENWGLVLFRPSAMLVGRAAHAREVMNVVAIVAHEVAHQWFGNLATCAWWNDLWLNEGFATLCATWFMASGYQYADPTDPMPTPQLDVVSALAPDHPAWVLWMTTEAAGSLHDRAVVDNAVLVTEADIAARFDNATYNRAAAILRLCILVAGFEAAVQGIRTYLQAALMQPYNGCVTEELLWECLGTKAGQVGTAWLRAAGLVAFVAGGGGPSGLPAVGLTDMGLGIVGTVTENVHFCMPAVVVRTSWTTEAAQTAATLALRLSPATAASMVIDADVALRDPATPQPVLLAQLQVLRSIAASAGSTVGAVPFVMQHAMDVLHDIADVCRQPHRASRMSEKEQPGPELQHHHPGLGRIDFVAAVRPGSKWTRHQVLEAVWKCPLAQLPLAFEEVVASGAAVEWLPATLASVMGARVVQAQDYDKPGNLTFDDALALVERHPMFLSEFMHGAADNGDAICAWLADAVGKSPSDADAQSPASHAFVHSNKYAVRSVAEVIAKAANVRGEHWATIIDNAFAVGTSSSSDTTGTHPAQPAPSKRLHSCAHETFTALRERGVMTAAEIQTLIDTIQRHAIEKAAVTNNVCSLLD